MKEITRERDPLKWAALQDNLGLALGSIGQTTGKTEPLEQALEAYNLALTERDRERVPLDWASTMNNIGNIHYRLGEFNHDAEEFARAVETFRLALQERTRERTASGWASTQNNLANALGGLGGFEDGIKSLREACDHYRLALEEYPRDVNPIGYADTQYNIALTLLEIARKTGKKQDFDATRAAIEASHSVYVEAGQTQYDQYFQNLELDVQIGRDSNGRSRRGRRNCRRGTAEGIASAAAMRSASSGKIAANRRRARVAERPGDSRPAAPASRGRRREGA